MKDLGKVLLIKELKKRGWIIEEFSTDLSDFIALGVSKSMPFFLRVFYLKFVEGKKEMEKLITDAKEELKNNKYLTYVFIIEGKVGRLRVVFYDETNSRIYDDECDKGFILDNFFGLMDFINFSDNDIDKNILQSRKELILLQAQLFLINILSEVFSDFLDEVRKDYLTLRSVG